MEQPVERTKSFVFGETGVPDSSRCTLVERPKGPQPPGAGQCLPGFELELSVPPVPQAGSKVSGTQVAAKMGPQEDSLL